MLFVVICLARAVENFSFSKEYSFQKLSELQKFVLVALMEPRFVTARPREFHAAIRRLYWGRDTPSTRKSLSRALQHLEQRGYIMRLDRHWQLTHSDASNNGVMMAFLAWAQRRELYAGAAPAENRQRRPRPGGDSKTDRFPKGASTRGSPKRAPRSKDSAGPGLKPALGNSP
jgi:hypothetical protein